MYFKKDRKNAFTLYLYAMVFIRTTNIKKIRYIISEAHQHTLNSSVNTAFFFNFQES
ncbi:hypothetical protein Hanom_Chr00s004448g01722681 [Helianthus anomalus]